MLATVAVPDSPLTRRLEYCVRTATAVNADHRYRTAKESHDDFRLVIDHPTSLQRPVDTALTLIQALIENESTDLESTRRLAQFLLEHRDELQLATRTLPRLPYVLLQALLTHHAPAMLPVLESYVSFLEEPLALDYVMTSLLPPGRDDQAAQARMISLQECTDQRGWSDCAGWAPPSRSASSAAASASGS